MVDAGVLRVVPVTGETTWSFAQRIAAAYGIAPLDLLAGWRISGSMVWKADPARWPDVEVVFNRAGQDALARLCGAGRESLARALPSWSSGTALFEDRADDPRMLGRWLMGAGRRWQPVVHACRLCVARRAGRADTGVVRYVPRFERVCGRHGRWLLDVGDGHDQEYLDLRDCPEVGRAHQRFAGIRAAGRAQPEAAQVFAVARAVVCWWWEQPAVWEREQLWPRRLERLAHTTERTAGRGGDRGSAGSGRAQGWWRVVGRDAVTFPEVVAVAATLLDPALREVVRKDMGGRRAGAVGSGAAFVQELGARLGRPWLGEVVGAQRTGPLVAWMGAAVPAGAVVGWGQRVREDHGARPPAVWRVWPGHQPAAVAVRLREVPDEPVPTAVIPHAPGPRAGGSARTQQQFRQGLAHAAAYAAEHGHLVVLHRARPGEFNLGAWLTNRRTKGPALPADQVGALEALDPWWNAPWPNSWQRAWHRARDHVGWTVSVDSTVCRAHQHSAGARKKGLLTGPSPRTTRSDALVAA